MMFSAGCWWVELEGKPSIAFPTTPPRASGEACAPGTQLCRRCCSGCNWSIRFTHICRRVTDDMDGLTNGSPSILCGAQQKPDMSFLLVTLQKSYWCPAEFGLLPWICTFVVFYSSKEAICLTSSLNHHPDQLSWAHLFQSPEKGCLTAAVRRCRRWWSSPSTWSSGSLLCLWRIIFPTSSIYHYYTDVIKYMLNFEG